MGSIPGPVAAEHALAPVDDALLLRAVLDVDGAGARAWSWLVERTGGLDGVLAGNPRLACHLPALAAASTTWRPPLDEGAAARLAERLADVVPEAPGPPEVVGSPEATLVEVLAAVFDDRTPSAHRDRRWVVDAVLLLRDHPELDWDEVHELAAHRHRTTATSTQLVHLREVFGAPVPAELEAGPRRQAGRTNEADRHETAALRTWARDDGADLRDVPRRTTSGRLVRLVASRGALVDRLRGRTDAAVLYCGEGHREDAVRTYPSPRAFVAGMPSRRPLAPDECRHLVVQNVADERLLTWTGPKVLFSLEPDDTPADRTAGLRARPELASCVVSFSDPDPARRTPYPALPLERRPWIERLRHDLRRPRPRLVVAVLAHRPDPTGFDQEELRQAWVHAFGHDVEVHGRSPEPPGWRTLPTCRGPVADKQHCLQDAAFTLCFENSDRPGYITEKPFEALLAGAIPLYRGGGGWIEQVLPDGAYVDCRDREPGDVLEQVRTMPEHERVERRAAGLAWLASPAADRHTWQGLAAVLRRRLDEQED